MAFLGLADELVVTADSVSMMVEACATGKRVRLFDLGTGRNSMRRPLGLAGERRLPWPGLRSWLQDASPRAELYRWAMRLAPTRTTRDIRLVHRELLATGRASWLDEAPPGRGPATPLHALDDLPRTAALVKRFVAVHGKAWPERAMPARPLVEAVA